MTQAVLVIGHGTRDQAGVTEFHALVAHVTDRLADVDAVVESAFLELVEPDIRQGIEACVRRGATAITLAPLLLFAAGHWKRDIPSEVKHVMADFPGVTTRSASALERHPAMAALVAERAADAGYAAGDTLLLVSRGSRDADATASFQAFAQDISVAHHIPDVRTAVMTGFGDSVCAALDSCLGRARRVVVVPYLLFRGLVLEELHEQVATWTGQHGDLPVTISPHLWPHTAVIDAFEARIRTAFG